MAALNPWTVNTRLKAKLERDEIGVCLRGLCFSMRKGGGVLSAVAGGVRQIKDLFVGEFCPFLMFILQLESALCGTLQGQPTAVKKKGMPLKNLVLCFH